MSIPIQAIRLSVVAAGIVAIVAFKTISSNMAEEKVDKVLAGLPAGLVTYESVSTDLFGLDVHINDVEIHPSPTSVSTIDEIVIKSIDNDHDVPNYLDLEINGIELDTESLKYDRSMAKLIDSLGYEKLKADLALNYSFDEDENSIDIDNVSFEIEDAGELSFDSKFEGINSLQNFSMQLMMAPQSIKIAKYSLKYKDDSLANRLIKFNAQKKHLSVEEFKESVLSQLSQSLQKAEDQENKYEITMLEEVIDFFKDPDSFEISISPKEAISLGELQRVNNPDKFLEKINLDISAN